MSLSHHIPSVWRMRWQRLGTGNGGIRGYYRINREDHQEVSMDGVHWTINQKNDHEKDVNMTFPIQLEGGRLIHQERQR